MKDFLSILYLVIALSILLIGSLTIILILSDYPEMIFASIAVYFSFNYLIDKV